MKPCPCKPFNGTEGQNNWKMITQFNKVFDREAGVVSKNYLSKQQPNPEYLCQSKQNWEHQCGHLCRTNKNYNVFGLSRFQLMLSEFSTRNSRVNFAIASPEWDWWIHTEYHALATPTIEDLLVSPLSKFNDFVVNECGYNGSFTDIFVTTVYPFFFKA